MRIPNLFKPQKRESVQQQTQQEKKGGVNVLARQVNANSQNAMLVTAFQRACELRAQTFSRGILTVEKNVGGVWIPYVQNITLARDYRHLNYLFQVKPNQFMTAQQMWRLAMWYRFSEGCGAIYMPGGWNVAHMAYPVHVSGWDMMSNTYTISSDHLMKSFVADDSELILLRGVYNRSNPLGESLVDIAKNSLGLYLTAERFTTDTIAKGGTMKMFVSEETSVDPLQGVGSLDDGQVKSAVDDVRDQISNNDDVVFVQGDLKTESRSQSFQDLQIGDARKEANESLARVCGVYGALIGLTVNSVYKSMDEAWHAFLETTMRTDWEEIEQELNGKIMGELNHGKLRFKFHTAHICLDSDHMKAQTAAARRAAGVTTANEERLYMGLPAVIGGDELNTPQKPANNETKEGGER